MAGIVPMGPSKAKPEAIIQGAITHKSRCNWEMNPFEETLSVGEAELQDQEVSLRQTRYFLTCRIVKHHLKPRSSTISPT